MTVSIVMTCYNSAKYINEQIDSILPELSKDMELIICDDQSKDNTVDIIKSYNDPRIKLYINERNYGAVRNLEHVISLANNEIIVIADSDNVWYEGKISKVLPYFSNPKVTMVMHDAIIVDSNLNVIMDSYFSWRKSKPGLIRNILKNGYGGSMMAFRKTMVRYILNSPKKMPCFYDEWIGMMCEKHGKCIFIDNKLSCWRRHDDVASSLDVHKKLDNKKEYFKNIKFFIFIIKDRLVKFWLAFTH